MFRHAIWAIALMVLVVGKAIPVSAGWFEDDSISIQDPIALSPNRLSLPDGTPFDLAKSISEKKLTIVCFLGTECPMVKLYAARLGGIAQRFADEGVQVIGIDSNRQDSAEEIAQFCAQQQLQFPVLRDEDNIVADDFRAIRTPEVSLVDANLNVLYRGCIDDQYSPGVARAKATQEYLWNAIEQALAGKVIEVPRVEASGCLIGRVASVQESSPVTFSNQVARVFHKHCIECHRPGEIGPFSLTDYEEAAGWGETIVEVIDNGRMPPWHASEGLAPLQNTRHMPESDKQLIRDWVAAGLPAGDPAELPALPEFASGWRLPREPDIVIEMSTQPFEIPAEGVVEYQYFVVDPGFTQDVWIATAEIVPGNRRVVHHSIVFVRPPEHRGTWGIGWLGAYVPGQSAPKILPGHATFVPAGSKLVFQQHYTPTGRVESDLTKIGIVFAQAAEVTHHVYTLASLEQEFEILPGESAHTVRSKLGDLSSHATLLAVSPHMHFRGKSYKLSLSRADGTSQALVDVPNYDFNWQHSYQFAHPIPLRGVRNFSSEFVFDNSAANPFNPDPQEYVTWGDQTWEEMAVSFLTVAEPLNAVREENSRIETVREAERERSQETAMQYASSKADEMFKQLDQDGDGTISRNETPKSFRHFAFNRYDSDNDGSITREECIETLLTNWSIKQSPPQGR